jgi:hypothetical protein
MTLALAAAAVAALVLVVAYAWEMLHPFNDMEYDDGNPEQ